MRKAREVVPDLAHLMDTESVNVFREAKRCCCCSSYVVVVVAAAAVFAAAVVAVVVTAAAVVVAVVCWLLNVGVSQGLICSDSCACSYSNVADQRVCLIQ